MRRGTTPTHIFDTDIDLRDATVYITYVQDGQIVLEKGNDDIEITEDSLTVALTQEETLKFDKSTVKVQIRFVTRDGKAGASDILRVNIEEILKDGVITYEGKS